MKKSIIFSFISFLFVSALVVFTFSISSCRYCPKTTNLNRTLNDSTIVYTWEGKTSNYRIIFSVNEVRDTTITNNTFFEKSTNNIYPGDNLSFSVESICFQHGVAGGESDYSNPDTDDYSFPNGEVASVAIVYPREGGKRHKSCVYCKYVKISPKYPIEEYKERYYSKRIYCACDTVQVNTKHCICHKRKSNGSSEEEDTIVCLPRIKMDNRSKKDDRFCVIGSK